MWKKNKIIMTILSFVLLSSVILPNLKADLDKESIDSAQKLADAWIIVDNSKNPALYNVSSSITRREMLKIILKIAQVTPSDKCDTKFVDLPKNDWWCKYAQKALELGFISPNKYFRPNDNISKVEAIKMLLKAKWITPLQTIDWREGYIKKAVELWYIDNFKDYDTKSKRSFVFKLWSKTISNNWLQISKIKEQIIPYEKTKLKVNFANNMDKSSVESNLKIYPEISYAINWNDDKNLEIILNDLIKQDTDILVNILDKATTLDWNKLAQTYVKKFKVDGYALIDFITPNWDISDLWQNITVSFSKPIVNLTNLDNQSFCPIEISPNLPWKCLWITTSAFQFRPERWFPTGAIYDVKIPSNIKTIAWDETINSKSFQIKTPEFSLISDINNLWVDESMKFAFNDEVSIESFKKNFSILNLPNEKLNFSYYKWKEDLEESKNIITVYPKNWDWWYSKNYTYTIWKELTSLRGNIWLKDIVSKNISIVDFLVSYWSVVLRDELKEDKYNINNLKYSQNNTIVTLENPKILLNFYKEVTLDKNLISSNIPFELNYIKTNEYIDWKNILKEDKKQILVSFSTKVNSRFSFNVNLSKFSSTSDKKLEFETKNKNQIISYKQLSYKKACIETQNPIDGNLSKYFTFDKFWIVDYLQQVNEWTNDNECQYVSWKYRYILSMRLNPNTSYKLIILSKLLDQDNYPLDKDYNYSFDTWKAVNEDKSLSIIDGRNLILLPSNASSINVWLQTINISKVNVKVCEGTLDIQSLNFLSNSNCITKTVSIKDLWFKPNISVMDLEKVYGAKFSKKYITLEISKIDEDKTEYEAKNDNYYGKASFIISDISAIIKYWKNNILWLHDYNVSKDLSDSILKIESYKKEANYWIFWNYIWDKFTFDKKITFNIKENWIYELLDSNYNILLITLKTWEQLIVDNIYNNYTENENIYTYISTDRPIYKAWDTVEISWVSRILESKWYKVNTSKLNLIVRDSQYKDILNTSITPNDLWAFSLKLQLNSDSKLWNYSIEVWWNSIDFSVEDYEKPDFKVELKSLNKTYLNRENAKILVNGEYYIWLPLSNANWDYTLSSKEYYFDWWKTTGYIFWKEKNYYLNNWISYKNRWFYDLWVNIETSWKFVLDNNWKANIDIPLLSSDNDKEYTISTTITDPNTKKSISSNTTFNSIRSSTFLWMKFDKYYYAFWDNANLSLVAVDIDGNKLKNQTFSYKVYKVDYIYDENNYNYDSKENLINEKTLSSWDTWVISEKFNFTKYWEYRFEISNWKYTTIKSIYVSWSDILRPEETKNSLDILSDKENYKVWDNAKFVISSPVIWVKALLTIEKLNEVIDYKIIDINSYSQELNIDIKKEFLPNFNVWLYIIKDIWINWAENLEKLKLIRSQMLDLEQKLQVEQKNSYIIYLSDYIVRDLSIIPPKQEENLDTDILLKLRNLRDEERGLLSKILPSYYTWFKEIKVDAESVKVSSNIKLDKESYLPWEKQTIELNLSDNYWKPIDWEVTISIIDQSLLALKTNKIDILDYFYSSKPISVQTFWNLSNLVKRIEFKTDDWLSQSTVSSESSFWLASEKSSMSDMAAWMPNKNLSLKNNLVENYIRTEFKDIAFYKTQIVVKNGKVIIEVPALPDNLTTWVIQWYVYTSQSKVWNFENIFKVKKPISILPQVPRFFLSWDKTQIWALVVNNTNSKISSKMALEITNANMIWSSNKILTIDANSSELVNFDVEILTWIIDNNISQIKIIADNEISPDSIIIQKPIYPSLTSEYVFTNWSSDNLSYEEKLNFEKVLKNWWYLEVNLWATILTNLTKNLDKVLVFPTEDLWSKLLFLDNALSLEKLYTKLDKIDNFKKISLTDYNWWVHYIEDVIDLVKNDIKNYVQKDYGLSYYKDCSLWWWSDICSSFYITKQYLNLELSLDWIDNKKLYLYYKTELEKNILENKKNGINTINIDDFLPIALNKDNDFISAYFKPDINLSNMQKLDYIKIYELLWEENELSKKYIKDLKNSVLIEARGSVLPTDKSYSPVDNTVSTAKMIKLLIKNNDFEKLLLENLVRFLISNRNDEGNYYTFNFSEVINALSDYVEFTNELKNVSFEAKMYLNNNILMTSKFDESNKFSIDKKVFNFSNYIKTGENSLWFEKTWTWKLYYDVWARYYISVSEMNSRDEWIIVSRNYYNYEDYKSAFKKECFVPWWYYDFWGYCINKKIKNIDNISNSNKWDYIVWEIQIVLDKERTNIVINDYIPAWSEILNTNLNTTSNDIKSISNKNSNWLYNGFDLIEQKDDKIYLYAKHLNAWTYTYTYVLKSNHIWNYNLKPATAELLEKPEIWWRSKWWNFEIK